MFLPNQLRCDEEIDFILQQIGKYLIHPPARKDIRSVFAGLRPLVKGDSKKTAELSRDHLIRVSPSGLIMVTGGKWTTYRRMAEDAVNTAIKYGALEQKDCVTEHLAIHGSVGHDDADHNSSVYGSDAVQLQQLTDKNNSLAELLHADLPYTRAEIVWAARNEMCLTVEDALSRRTRALLLDARAAIACAPEVARVLAAELGRPQVWIDQQVIDFTKLAKNYFPA